MEIIQIITMEGGTYFKNHMQSAKGTQKIDSVTLSVPNFL